MKNTIKTMLLFTIVLIATSCKKEKKEEPYVAPEKLYVLEYRGTISGPNVTGKLIYYDFTTGQQTTKLFTGTTQSTFFTIKKGAFLQLTVYAESDILNSPTGTAEIYIDGVKYFSATKTEAYSTYVTASGTFN